ncbi:MAG: hypothetical protein GYA02_03695 [Clostridiaceae bacterium]|jgi:hypothetical protein|nr:hypothetical protein [Clostridiaceae bacterium]
MRNLLFVFMVLILNGQSYSVGKNRCDSLKEVLFSDYFKDWHKDGMVQRIIDEMAEEKCPEYEKTFYKFSVENNLYRKHSLGKMAEYRMRSFITFLYKYGDSLDSPTLFTCIVSLNSKNPWINDSLLDYLTHIVISHPASSTRITALCHLANAARLEDCNILADRMKYEPEERIHLFYYRVLVRFSTKKIDSLVLRYIPRTKDEYFFDYLKDNHRYDLLPELYTLKEQLKNEKKPLMKGVAKDMLIQLEEVLPILEKKKAEKAPIGLPLDWGIEKKDGKVKISNK